MAVTVYLKIFVDPIVVSINDSGRLADFMLRFYITQESEQRIYLSREEAIELNNQLTEALNGN